MKQVMGDIGKALCVVAALVVLLLLTAGNIDPIGVAFFLLLAVVGLISFYYFRLSRILRRLMQEKSVMEKIDEMDDYDEHLMEKK